MNDKEMKQYFFARLLRDEKYELILQNIGLINEIEFLKYLQIRKNNVPTVIKTEKIINNCFDIDCPPNSKNRVILHLLFGNEYPVYKKAGIGFIFCPTEDEFYSYLKSTPKIFEFSDLFTSDICKYVPLLKELVKWFP